MLLHTISKLKSRGKREVQKITGKVVLLRSNSLDYNEIQSSVLDNISEFWGAKVSFQLISSVNGDRCKFLPFLIICFIFLPVISLVYIYIFYISQNIFKFSDNF